MKPMIGRGEERPRLLFEISGDKINPASMKAQVGYE